MSVELHDVSSRWQVNVTYRCNLACKECIQYLDRIKFVDSDIDVELVRIANNLIRENNINAGMTRISGGEPLLHKNFVDICRVVVDEWKPSKVVVCTNAVIQNRPTIEGIKYRKSPPSWKEIRHRPCLVSPKDLGMAPKDGFGSWCSVTKRCGRMFDKYGFAACGNSASIGRLLRIDPYHNRPVSFGLKSMCEHCVFTLPRSKRLKLWDMVESGKVPNPTKTYNKGLERDREEPFQYMAFQDRL